MCLNTVLHWMYCTVCLNSVMPVPHVICTLISGAGCRSLGAVGSVAQGSVFVVALQTLMDELGQHNEELRAAAFNQIMVVVSKHCASQWQPELLTSLAKTLIAQQDRDGLIPLYLARALGKHNSMVDEVVDAVFGDTPQEYFERKENLIAAMTGILKTRDLWDLVPIVAKVIDRAPAEILDSEFQIVIEVLRQADDEEHIVSSMNHVEQITGKRLGDRMLDDDFVNGVLEAFIMDLASDVKERKQRAIAVLETTAKIKSSDEDLATDDEYGAYLSQLASQREVHGEELKHFLDKHFLYVMHHCIEPPLIKVGGQTVVKNKAAVADAKMALRSLRQLFRLMGAAILSAYVPKVIVTLKLVLTQQSDGGLCEEALDAFLDFIQELTAANVGSSLSQMVVIVLEHVHSHPDKVIAVLELLVVHGRSALEGQFNEILFIPTTSSVPALHKVNETLSKVCTCVSLCRIMLCFVSLCFCTSLAMSLAVSSCLYTSLAVSLCLSVCQSLCSIQQCCQLLCVSSV